MDLSVLHKLTYGMYAVGTLDGIRPAGCIVNTVIQVTSDNPVIAVSMNKNNFTYEAIKRAGVSVFRFCLKRLNVMLLQSLDLPVGAKWINSAVKILPAVFWRGYR